MGEYFHKTRKFLHISLFSIRVVEPKDICDDEWGNKQ